MRRCGTTWGGRGIALLVLCALAACGTDRRGSGEAERSRAEADARMDGPSAVAPAPTGMDSALLAAALARGAGLPRLRGLVVARHGEIRAERYWRGGAADRHHNLKSASKSVLAALVGIAVREGHLRGVEQPVAEILPEHFGGGSDPRKRAITVGHLLSMQSGLESTSFAGYGAWVSSPHWVRDALSRPLVDRPGRRMLYSTGSSHVLSAVLTRATGENTYDYARTRLAEPLGIRLRPWQRDPQGIYLGGNEMHMTPRELLRFGQMYLDGGAWRGRQVVPRAWVEESLRPRTTSPWNGHGYGLGWWSREAAGRRVEFAWGYGGQYVFLVRDLGVVAVMVSDPAAPDRDGGHLRALHDLVDDYLIPAAVRGGGAGAEGVGPTESRSRKGNG